MKSKTRPPPGAIRNQIDSHSLLIIIDMSAPLNYHAEQWKKRALKNGKITIDTSPRKYLYEISRLWRKMIDGKPQGLMQYDGRELQAARIIVAAIKYLKIKNPKIKIDNIVKSVLQSDDNV